MYVNSLAWPGGNSVDSRPKYLMSFVLADPLNGEQVNFLLWAAHNLERAADRVTNLCERVIYTVTGNFVEMDPEDSGLESIR